MPLLARQDELLAMGYPLLAGWSRKSSLGAVTGLDVDQRLIPSVTAALLAVERGARMWFVCTMCVKLCKLAVWKAMRSEGSEPQRPSQGRVSPLHGAAAMLCQAGIFHPHASREASPFMLYGPLKSAAAHFRRLNASFICVIPAHCRHLLSQVIALSNEFEY